MNLQKILPFDNYTLSTNLSEVEVQARIAKNIAPQTNFRMLFSSGNRPEPYEGKITGNYFEINRIINYRNPFLPVIKGHISSSTGRTIISIEMRPVILVLIFMTFWLGIVGAACFAIIGGAIIQFKEILKEGFSPLILIPFAMFVFGYCLLMIPYKLESKKSKEFLVNLLEAQQL